MSRGPAEGWLRCLAHPFVVLNAQVGTYQYLILFPTICVCSWLFRSDKWAFCLCTFWSSICPNCACTHFFFSPFIVSLCFVAGGEVCPGVSIAALQQKFPGLRPVSKLVFFITDLLFCRAKPFLSWLHCELKFYHGIFLKTQLLVSFSLSATSLFIWACLI